ncbi:MAG: hypothetical protein CL693_09805 [Cellvibrionaceae bacterium]|nr:hypothetical protein [Cellvibrionaceae bacterium]
MMSSYSLTTTESTTFTVTHARHIAAKVATDLKRMQRFYDKPSNRAIDDYEKEVTEFLKHGYLKKVTYGFQRNGNWIEPTLMYTAQELGMASNDDPGKIRPGKDISGANFKSYLEYSSSWWSLSDSEKEQFRGNVPVQRNGTDEPGIDGYLDSDKTYSSGGKSLSRSSVRSY